MAVTSPLDHSELREIEKTLDEGNTQEAATRLGMLGDARDHKDAIDFLTTRLLFQRGRIDSDGAADRVGAILDRVEHFPEAEDWLNELEARTERSALGDGFVKERGDSPREGSTPPPASKAPNIDPHHPYFDELGPDDDITPTESSSARSDDEDDASGDDDADSGDLDGDDVDDEDVEDVEDDDVEDDDDDDVEDDDDDDEEAHDDATDDGESDPGDAGTDAGVIDRRTRPPLTRASRDSSLGGRGFGVEPPTRPGVPGARRPLSEPPTRPDVTRPKRPPEPSTQPDLVRAELMGHDASAHPSYKPFDSLRAKEQLSAKAGRYRGGVNDPGEVLGGPRKPRASNPARTSHRVPLDPERRILEAFQMVRDGMLDEARRLVPDEGTATTSRPELRAMLGRVLLELGQAERATGEAAFALEHAPQSADVQLVFVWSAVRYARQRDDAWSLERAGRLLKDLPQGAALDPGLLDALAACVEVRVGVPTVALRLAQRALRSNADSIDALAALAEASALCHEEQRAQTALERLHELSEEAAEQLAPRLSRLGVGAHGPASSASVWLPLEHTLSSGAREVALTGLEALASDAVAHDIPDPWEDADAAARSAADFLTLAPVLRHFGPFDLSLHGIDRLEAALDLIHGPGPRAMEAPGSGQGIWKIAGLYLGETLRACCEGRWLAAPERLEDATLALLGGEVQPFQVVRRRILHGRHAPLKAALGAALALAPPAAHGVRAPERLAPELPWGDGLWPTVADLPRLGRALGHSVVATYAAAHGQPRLDRSGASLAGIDHYLELVAPADSPLAEDAGWTRWLCVFLGAYLGEVLCREFDGSWGLGDRPEAESFVVNLGSRQELPLALLLDSVTGRHPMSLADYLGQLRHTLGSP